MYFWLRKATGRHRAKLREVSKFIYEWTSYGYSLRKPNSAQTKFIYWAEARTGSHLFADLMNSHPSIKCVTEHALFLKRSGVIYPYNYIDGVSKRTATAVWGGKMNIRQLNQQRGNLEYIIARLHRDGWKFIILTRQNLLEQAISEQVAQKRARFHDTSQPTLTDMQIEIDLPRLHSRMKQLRMHNKQTTDILKHYDTLQLTYEGDLIGADAQQRCANHVFEFLDIPTVKVKTRLVKTAAYALSEYVTNYDEVVFSLLHEAHSNIRKINEMADSGISYARGWLDEHHAVIERES